jgi:hypothetical protein
VAAGCTPYPEKGEPPVAVAGEDQALVGASVQVTLDGTRSYDPDGDIVAHQWRFTGWPAGYQPSGAAGGPAPTNPTTDPLSQPPAFCSTEEIFEGEPVQIRFCLVAKTPTTTVTLEPGGYRFTLYVEDDEGIVSGDTVNVLVTP